MDDRLRLKYQQLPDGEQAGKRPQAQTTAREEGRRRPVGFGAGKSGPGEDKG
jgi:hypothetical protein